MEKMKLVEKLFLAKKEIKETKVKKEGENKFSNYKYFTPTQIEFLVQNACINNRILTTFDLNRDALGVFGVLTIHDLDSDEKLSLTMASAIPEIKATNIAQQLGGCVTYTERYLKTSAFGITDNNLDFDNHDNTQQKEVTNPIQPKSDTKAVIDKNWDFLKKLFDEVSDKIDADKFDSVKATVLGKNPKFYEYTLKTLNDLK